MTFKPIAFQIESAELLPLLLVLRALEHTTQLAAEFRTPRSLRLQEFGPNVFHRAKVIDQGGRAIEHLAQSLW